MRKVEKVRRELEKRIAILIDNLFYFFSCLMIFLIQTSSFKMRILERKISIMIDFEQELRGIHFENDEGKDLKAIVDDEGATTKADNELIALFERYMDNENSFWEAQEAMKVSSDERRAILRGLKAKTKGKPFLVRNGDEKRFLVRVYGFGLVVKELEEVNFFDFAL